MENNVSNENKDIGAVPTPPYIHIESDKKPIVDEKLFPTENIPKNKRFKTSFWLKKTTVSNFKDACHIAGRKSCDVIEPLMEMWIKSVKNKALKKVDVCPFKAVQINIETLKIEQKYDKRGPKDFNKDYSVFCEKAGKYLDKVYCLSTCMFGGNRNKYGNNPCKKYSGLV